MSRQRKVVVASVAVVSVLLALFFVQIPVTRIQTRTELPGFVRGVWAQASEGEETGVVDVTLTDFNFTVGDTQLMGKQADIHVELTNITETEGRIDLSISLQEFEFRSPDASGSFGSATLSGFVLVNPETNELFVSLTGSTSIIDIITNLVGL